MFLVNLDTSPTTLGLVNHADLESILPTLEVQAAWCVVVDEKLTQHEPNVPCVLSDRSRQTMDNVNYVQWENSHLFLVLVNVIHAGLVLK